MIYWGRRTERAASIFVLGLACLLATPPGSGQPPGESAADLIRYLTYQSGRQGRAQREALFECSMMMEAARQDRSAANSLVKLGMSAVPEIERAFASMEKLGPQSPFLFNGSWLLIAYAKILGAAAYPRLQRMTGNPRLGEYEYFLDDSLAVSLGLTSFVNGLGEGYGTGVTCGGKEPRDGLDRFILAWEKNDRASFEASLGPKGKASLRSLIQGRTWARMRGEFWHGGAGRGVAVGYRFQTEGTWAEPGENLDEALALARAKLDKSRLPLNPDLDTLFKNRSGEACGSQRVQFLTSEDSLFHLLPVYLVDSSELGDLLRTISACATGGGRGR